MSQYSNSGIRENHSKLSPRSKRAVQKVLSDSRMTYCLHKLNNNGAPFCGDGVVQNGEVKKKSFGIILRSHPNHRHLTSVFQLFILGMRLWVNRGLSC